MLTNEQLIKIIHTWDITIACIDNRLNRTIVDLIDPRQLFSISIEKADYLPKLYYIVVYKFDEKKFLNPITMVSGISKEIELEFNYILTTRATKWVQEQLDRLVEGENKINGFEKLL